MNFTNETENFKEISCFYQLRMSKERTADFDFHEYTVRKDLDELCNQMHHPITGLTKKSLI